MKPYKLSKEEKRLLSTLENGEAKEIATQSKAIQELTNSVRQAIVSHQIANEPAILSEASLSRGWERPNEDDAWSSLK